MDREHVMEGVVDLSFEAFNDLDNLPSAAGRGWLAADLSQDDWTVPLGPGAREEAGLPADSGPYKVITDLAVLGYDEQTRRMQVESLHPGVSLEQVQENTGFELGCAAQIDQTEPPREEELRLLREEVDPFRYVIGR
jgi:hypothetical protein